MRSFRRPLYWCVCRQICNVSLLCAAEQAKVDLGPFKQGWGYVTVRPGAHMFWWLYYTPNSPIDRPLVMWLQGGPGVSATGVGNFLEFGPVDMNLNRRNHTWVNDVNVLFVDNPVGTGYSYVNNESLLAKTNQQIAQDLLELMRGFYQSKPSFKSTPLYIVSQSYGGKMATEFALLLNSAIKTKVLEANFKGIALGGSWISPLDSTLSWAPFLYNAGAIDKNGLRVVNEELEKFRDEVTSEKYEIARYTWLNLQEIVHNLTNRINFYNILSKEPEPTQELEQLMNGAVKEYLCLPEDIRWEKMNDRVFHATGDMMKSVTHIVELLLNTTNLKIVVYTGQLDLVVATPGTVEWVDKLRWSKKFNWLETIREPLVINGVTEGYMKVFENFAMFWVNRAGHLVPKDNPTAMEYILRFLTDNYNQ